MAPSKPITINIHPVLPTFARAKPLAVTEVEEGAALAANAVPLSAFATFWKAWKLRPEDSSELMALSSVFSPLCR
jgi:hypothetical protein